MQNSKRETLDQWIREAMTDEEKDGKISSLALVHVVAGNNHQEVYAVKFGGKQWAVPDLAKLFLTKAQNYAAEMSGVQMFLLLAFYASRAEPQARKPFRIQPHAESETASQSTEGPTKEGFMAQMMRHNEATMQTMLRQTGMLFSSMNQLVSTLSAERTTYMRENADAYAIVKELVMQRDDQMHTRRMKELDFVRSSQERKQWLSFGPALINTVLGREVFPVASQDTSLIETIAQNVSEEDLQAIAQSGLIKPQVLGPLAARLTDFIKKKRLQQEEVDRVMASDLRDYQQLSNGKDVDPPLDSDGEEAIQ